jgi:class 3 adenylate cyclase
MTPGSVTLLFTDLVNSAELLQRASDEQAQRIFRAHHRLLKRFGAAHGGQEVKWLGDGFLTVFASPVERSAGVRRPEPSGSAAVLQRCPARILREPERPGERVVLAPFDGRELVSRFARSDPGRANTSAGAVGRRLTPARGFRRANASSSRS